MVSECLPINFCQVHDAQPRRVCAGTHHAAVKYRPGVCGVQDMRDLGKQYVKTMQARIPPSRSNATRIVDKMLRNVWNIGYISMMLPGACVIQVVRHPLDTALSCFAQPFEGRGTPWAWDLQGNWLQHSFGRLWFAV